MAPAIEVAQQGEPSGDAWERGDFSAQRPNEESPRRGGEAVVQTYTNPPSLNTITHSDRWATWMTAGAIYEGLLSYDYYDHPNYRPIPGLAERYTVSEDKRTFTFYLRRGVKFHDGSDFDANDVKATMDKVMDEGVTSAHLRSYFSELEAYEVLDPFTIQFRYKTAYFMALDMIGGVPIQPDTVIEKMSASDYNDASNNPLLRHPVGTGPFKFIEWVNNERIVYERYEDYWGRKAYLDKLVFRYVPEPDVGIQLAEREELDLVNRILPEKWVSMNSRTLREKYDRYRFVDNNYAWIGWNLRRPFFSDKRVRRALTMLTDRPGIVEHLEYNLYAPSDCIFYIESKELCGTDLAPIPYDPAGAVKLLNEAGWKDSDGDGVLDKDGVKFAFTFMVPSSSESAKRMAAKMKEDFVRAGIDMGVQPVEWTGFIKRVREGKFDACTMLWGSNIPRTDPTQIWHSSSQGGGSNYIGFSNPEADRLMEEARVEFDESVRNAKYRKLMDLLREEQPYTWLYSRTSLYLYHHRLRGVRPSLLGWRYVDWWVEDGEPTDKAAAKAE